MALSLIFLWNNRSSLIVSLLNVKIKFKGLGKSYLVAEMLSPDLIINWCKYHVRNAKDRVCSEVTANGNAQQVAWAHGLGLQQLVVENRRNSYHSWQSYCVLGPGLRDWFHTISFDKERSRKVECLSVAEPEFEPGGSDSTVWRRNRHHAPEPRQPHCFRGPQRGGEMQWDFQFQPHSGQFQLDLMKDC